MPEGVLIFKIYATTTLCSTLLAHSGYYYFDILGQRNVE